MKSLEEKILREGNVKDGGILKVDRFLNHQLDVEFLNEIGKEFAKRFSDVKINKILTIEASGIAIASIAAQHFNPIPPVVFAKKAKSQNIDGETYTSVVESYTYKKNFTITVAKKFLTEDDHILLIDDFLAQGNAAKGLIRVIEQSGATLEGIGIVIEKGFQDGGKLIRDRGYRVESLAIIESLEDGKITFKK